MKRNRSIKPPKNWRQHYYDRVIMPRESERWKKFGALCGLAFVGILIVGLIAALTGCAAKRPKPAHQKAQLVIPRECAGNAEFTKATRCKTIPGNAQKAVCSSMLVDVRCVRSVAR